MGGKSFSRRVRFFNVYLPIAWHEIMNSKSLKIFQDQIIANLP